MDRFDATPPYHESVLALDLATGRFRWAFRPRDTDRCDFDCGASANILHIRGTRYIGVGGKDGTYCVLRAYHTGTGQLLAAWPLPGAVHSSPAIVGRVIYVGTGNSFDGAGSAVHALRLPVQ